MSELNPPVDLHNAAHTAQVDRLVREAMLSGDHGVYPGTGLKVTQVATPSMQVRVAAGWWFLTSSFDHGGMYAGYNDAHVPLDIAASDETNDRLDIVVVRVADSAQAATPNDDEWHLEVVTGTPSGAPTAPVVPEDALLLATIEVEANATQIEDADIVDGRVAADCWTRPRGRLERITSSSEQGPITTEVDLTGLTTTFDAESGRRYEVTGRVCVRPDDTDGINGRLILADGSNTPLDLDGQPVIPSTSAVNAQRKVVVHEFVGDGSSVTRKLRITASGDGWHVAANAGARLSTLKVDDIGGVLM